MTALRFLRAVAGGAATAVLVALPVLGQAKHKPRTESVPVAASIPGAPAGVTAFVDVGVVPMDTDRVLEHQTVLVEHGRVTAIGPTDQVQVPAGATRIDGRGEYLIPGLADMHAHLFPGAEWPGGDSVALEQRFLMWLANGATAIRNMDWLLALYRSPPSVRVTLTRARTALLQRARARVAAGELLGPRFITAGPWMDPGAMQIPEVPPKQPRSDMIDGHSRTDVVFGVEPKDVAARLATYKTAGFDFVKPYFEDLTLFDSLAAAGERLGLPLVGHVPPGVPVEHALPHMKSVEHLTGYELRDLGDTAVVRRLVAATLAAGTWNCPTLAINEALRRRENRQHRAFVKALSDAGAKLLAGTDLPMPQPGMLARELVVLVATGLTPYQALVTATRNPAEYFGTLDETGTIAIGKRADFVLIRGNPLENIAWTANIHGVMLGGRWVLQEEIYQRLRASSAGRPR